MKNKNILGYCHHIDERTENSLSSLNESIEKIILNKEFKAIKDVYFFIEDSDSDNLSLNVKVSFRNGSVAEEVFASHVDKGALDLSKSEIEAYFPEESFNKILKHIEDDVLSSDYLEAHEPELFIQLSKQYLVSLSPNVNDGAEFTESDREFFLKLIQKHQ